MHKPPPTDVASKMPFRRSVGLVAGLALVMGILAAIVSAILPSKFASASTLFVAVGGAESTSEVAQGGVFIAGRMKSYMSLATSAQVIEPSVAEVGGVSSGELKSAIQVEAVPDTTAMTVTVEYGSAQGAQVLADAVARNLAAAITKIETGTNSVAAVDVTVVSPAQMALTKAYPNVALNVALGILLGGALGGLVALVMGRYSRPARSIASGIDASESGI